MPINTMTPASQANPTMPHITCHASEGTYTIPRHWQVVPCISHYSPLYEDTRTYATCQPRPTAQHTGGVMGKGTKGSDCWNVGPRLVQWHHPEAQHVLPCSPTHDHHIHTRWLRPLPFVAGLISCATQASCRGTMSATVHATSNVAGQWVGLYRPLPLHMKWKDDGRHKGRRR
jgi:hypothetical protein